MTEKMYKVHNNNGTEDASEPKPKRRKAYITGGMYYIALRPAIKGEVQGEYWIYAHRDGAYTVLPCPPAPELKTVKMPEQPKEPEVKTG